MTSESTQYPPSWAVVPLGRFVNYNKGKRPSVLSKSQTPKCSVPYVDIKAFEEGIVEQWTDGSDCQMCEESDFLMVWDGSRSGLVGRFGKGALGSTLMRLNFGKINNQYAFYFLQSKFLEINSRTKGTGTPHVDPDLLWNYQFPIPPLNEQARIVNKIEELFSELDESVESLRSAQAQLKVYRQALLKNAFEGRLTATWRQENHFTIDEFEKAESSHLPEIPKCWSYVRAEHLCHFITKGTTPTKGNLLNGNGDVPFIKVYNLTFDGALDFRIDPTFVSNATHKGFLKRSICYPGDVLMNIVGPPLGKVSMVPDLFPEWNINQAIARFRPSRHLRPRYLMYFLLSSITVDRTAKKAKATAGQFNLTLAICRDIEVPLCHTLEQEQIVQILDAQLSNAAQIGSEIDLALSKTSALKQAILRQAFSGKLVGQDPSDAPTETLTAEVKAPQTSNNGNTPKISKTRKKNEHIDHCL